MQKPNAMLTSCAPGGSATGGDSLMAKQLSFQMEIGGSIPTSPLQLIVSPIPKATAALCYQKWHYLKEKGFRSSLSYGAFYEGQIWGAITFHGVSAPETVVGLFGLDRNDQNGIFEIGRLAMDDRCPKNSESRFIAVSIRLLRKIFSVRAVITYADTAVGHVGTIYKATGFSYIGLTDPKADFWVNGKVQERGKTKGIDGEWRPRSQKHRYVKIFDTKLSLLCRS